MNKSDLIEVLKKERRLSKNKVRYLVDLLFRKILDTLASGNMVEIRGFSGVSAKDHRGHSSEALG